MTGKWKWHNCTKIRKKIVSSGLNIKEIKEDIKGGKEAVLEQKQRRWRSEK